MPYIVAAKFLYSQKRAYMASKGEYDSDRSSLIVQLTKTWNWVAIVLTDIYDRTTVSLRRPLPGSRCFIMGSKTERFTFDYSQRETLV